MNPTSPTPNRLHPTPPNRIFSNVIYFTGRAYAGEDGLDSLTSRAGSYAKRVKWVNANRAAIVDSVNSLMRVPASAAAAAPR